MTKRIAFIYFSFSSFIRQDYEILSRYYDVEHVKFSGVKDIMKIVNAVRTSDVSYTWFAADAAFFAVAASKVFRKKSIVVIGGYDVANEPEIGYGMGTTNIIRRLMSKFALKYADAVLPVSKFTQRETEKCTTDNVKMVYNGVDLDNFIPSGTKNEMVLTVVSERNMVRKGMVVYVKIAQAMPSVKFVIIGVTDEQMLTFYPDYNTLNNLIAVGVVPDHVLIDYYRRAKVYCQLSSYEAFGMALAEAMACECIPVVSDKGGMPEVVGDAGICVSFGDVSATVAAIEEAFTSSNMQPRKQIVDNFSFQRRESALQNIIDYNLKDSRTRNRLRKSVKMADIKSGERVLDLGCGDSAIKAIIPDDGDYIGVDRDIGEIHYNLEDGIPEEIRGTEFDVIFMNEFIEHIENFRSLLIQCMNMLSENGRIIISTPSSNRIMFGEDPTHVHCFRKSNMRNLADICDLHINKITGTYLGIPYIPMIHSPQTLLTGVIIYRLMKKEVS